jgi:hypothetical protein
MMMPLVERAALGEVWENQFHSARRREGVGRLPDLLLTYCKTGKGLRVAGSCWRQLNNCQFRVHSNQAAWNGLCQPLLYPGGP